MSNIKQPASPEEAIQNAKPSDASEVLPAAKSVEDLVPAAVRTLTQAEIDREASLIRLQTEKLRLDKERLELEKLIADVDKIRRINEQQKMSRETVQESLEYERNERIRNETYCTHMKGGDSASMMHGGPAQGNDSANYAMIQHTLTTGVTFRMCLRCGKTWFPKDPDYRWAMTRPTRNSASTGSPSPGLVRNVKHVRLVSEVPHMKPTEQNWELPEYHFPNAKPDRN